MRKIVLTVGSSVIFVMISLVILNIKNVSATSLEHVNTSWPATEFDFARSLDEDATTLSVFYAAPASIGSGNCSNWENACTLKSALDQSTSGEIWVKAGIHYPGTSQTDYFELKPGVALYGGFSGSETERTQRNSSANLTILSGDIDQNDTTNTDGVVVNTDNINGNNSNHVVMLNESADEVFSCANRINQSGDTHEVKHIGRVNQSAPILDGVYNYCRRFRFNAKLSRRWRVANFNWKPYII